MKKVTLPLLVASLCLCASSALFTSNSHSQAAAPADPSGSQRLEQLEKQLKGLEAMVPDQAAVMSHVGYHFSNLWVAVEQENWPLADFYLGETRNNVKWAVRAKPIRKTAAGQIDLTAIAQAIDNAQFSDLKKAIAAKNKEETEKLYDQTLTACYACHKASEKPYLRPQRPSHAEAPIINFNPQATFPQ
jgi:cytochrome c553